MTSSSGQLERALAVPADAVKRRVGEPDAELVEHIDSGCDRASFVSTLSLLEPFAEPEHWSSPRGMCAAARLFRHLGAPQRARRLVLRAYRRNQSSAETRFWIGFETLELRGPLAVLEQLEEYEAPADSPSRSLAGLCWVRAIALTTLRDFDRAEHWLTRGMEIAPHEPYGGVLRVSWLAAQDLYDEALAAARTLFRDHPWHKSSIESLSHLLEIHGDWRGALETLLEGAQKLEAGSLYLYAAKIQHELRQYAAALASLNRAEELLALREQELCTAFAALRADVAYGLGDDATAIAEAERAGGAFFERLAARLVERRQGARVLLDVGFVRQHHLTCVPATLATIGRYWQRSVDHLEVADRICFDGTRSYAERRWAEQNGWVAREFTVTWESARALLDRGVPFTVDTVAATAAHAQAVIGYDERRGTLYIRDPFTPGTVEFLADEFFRAFEAHGPRGFALVPEGRAELLSGLQLPDSELYSALDRVEAALERHDRAAAQDHASAIDRTAPGHRLSLFAARAIASYDANPFELERATERALSRYPKEPTLLLSLFGTLRQTGTHERLVKWLEDTAAADDAHPVFRELLAAELLSDGRNVAVAGRFLRRVARTLRDRADTVGQLGRCAWLMLDHERALTRFRWAACLEPTSEQWAGTYFRASAALGRPEAALDFLRNRAERYLRRASGPSISLFSALESLDRTQEAFTILARAAEQRPLDGDLLRFSAECYARYGQFDRAREKLAAAEACSARTAWLRSSATVHTCAGDHEAAHQALTEVVASEPLSVDAHADLAAKLKTLYGPGKAREHLRATSLRFPDNAALLELYVAWESGEDPKRTLALVERLTVLQPSNAWAHRERALILGRLGRFAEAREACRLALELAPHLASGQLVLARMCELEGDFEGAKAAYWAALALSPDAEHAIQTLVDSAESTEETLETLARIFTSVLASSASGEGVIAWFRAARRYLKREQLERRLAELEERRPELWTVWQANIHHHVDAAQLEQAVAIGRRATERFPLLPALWLELGRALRLSKQNDAALEAMERAVEISPGFDQAALMLSSALANSGAADHGLSAIERALRHSPLDARLLAARANTLFRLKRRDEALATLRRAIEADPSDGASWERLAEFARAAESDLDVVELVKAIAESRPWDPVLLVRMAEIEADLDPNAALATVERAIALDPTSLEAHDLRVTLAAQLGHRALAAAACRPKQFGKRIPLTLRGREVWLEAIFGERSRAIAEMQKIVRERPDYVWGLRQIADWAEQIGDHDAGLDAAKALARLDPGSAWVHGYLGKALLDANQPSAARRAFRRAMELDANYVYAKHQYLELLLKERELGRLRRTLERVAGTSTPSEVRYFTLRLALAEHDESAVTRTAFELFSDPDAPETLLEASRNALQQDSPARANRILSEVLKQPGASAFLAAAWAQSRAESGSAPGAFELWRLERRNAEHGKAAIRVALDSHGDRRWSLDALFIALLNWRVCRSDVDLWGAMGYVLCNTSHPLLTLIWMWDHERRHPTPWMLLNLAISLRALGFATAAARVGRRALELKPDHTLSAHVTLLALDAALAARAIEARTLLDDAGSAHISPYFEHIHGLATALTVLASPERDEHDDALNQAWVDLALLMPTRFFGCFALETIQWRRAARAIGRASGRLDGWLRGHWDSALAVALVVFPVYLVASGQASLLTPLIPVVVLIYVFRRMSR